MANYRLKNGLVVEAVSFFPNVNDQFSFLIKGNRGVDPLLRSFKFSSGTMDNNGNVNAEAIAIACDVDVPKLTKYQFQNNTVQFAQKVRFVEKTTTYFGAKPEDGSTTLSIKDGSLFATKPLLDCLTAPDDTLPGLVGLEAVNFPFYDKKNTTRRSHIPPHRYSVVMNDTPGATMPLLVTNSLSKKGNFLQSYTMKAIFNSIIIFIHEDGSREPLESQLWSCEMDLSLSWRKNEPKVSEASVKVRALDHSLPEFSNSDFEQLVKEKNVANVVDNFDMQNNLRGSSLYDYKESANSKSLADFWLF